MEKRRRRRGEERRGYKGKGKVGWVGRVGRGREEKGRGGVEEKEKED